MVRTAIVHAKTANNCVFSLFLISDFIIHPAAMEVGTSIKNASFGAYRKLSGAFVRFVSTGEK